MHHVLALLALLLLTPSMALAYNGTLTPPELKADQYVYTVPDGWSPPGVGAKGMETLNGQLKGLHYPFYVVFVKQLPNLDSAQHADARSNGFGGGRDTIKVEYAASGVAKDWAEASDQFVYWDEAKDAAFNVSTDTVFILSWDPRKYAWVPGGDRRSRLGLEKGRLKPFESPFVRSVQRNPPDPVGGITALAQQFDQHVYDLTDPGRIAQREEQARQEALARRMRAAQGALDEQILRLDTLLGKTDHLPGDVSSYQDTLSEARTVRKAGKPDAMLAEAQRMTGTVDVLEHHVEESQSAARAAAFATFLQWFLILSVLGLIAFLLRKRWTTLTEARQRFTEALQEWEGRINNAHGRWSDLFLEREDLIGLDGVTGETEALYSKVTKAVDEILIAILAMGKHLERCKALAAKGNYFRVTPLTAAYLKLDEPFDFDTGVVNRADLFGGETVTIKVKPEDFAQQTKELFAEAMSGWGTLQKAAELRMVAAEDHFTHDTMDQLFADADKYGIPNRWIDDHPLFGDDASDATFYEGLNTVRENDPTAYQRLLLAAQSREEAIVGRLKRVIKAVSTVKSTGIGSVAYDPRGTLVDPEDDPTATLAEARQEVDNFAGILAAAKGHNPDPLITKATLVKDLGDHLRAQIGAIEHAVDEAGGVIESARALFRAKESRFEEVTQTVRRAARKYTRIRPAESDLQTAGRFLGRAEFLIKQADAQLAANRHLDARRSADEATGTLKRCEGQLKAAEGHCDALAAEEANFRKRAAGLSSTRDGYARKMRQYDGHTIRLAAATDLSVDNNGVNDFAALNARIDQQESHWQSQLNKARRAYEDEQRRIREAEEAARRAKRAAEDAERRRRSSYSSSSSSSSSSYGGGGFGGSSGSSGGGGFGGSSGSW